MAAPPPPVVNGELTSDYPAAGALVAVWQGYGQLVCSGTLVEPSWVLTAGHCAEAAGWVWDYGWDLYFVMGDEIYSGAAVDAYVLVDYADHHPDYNSVTLANDIGVVHLAEPVASVTPLTISDEEVDSTWVGESFTFVGFGVTSSALEGAGYKRVVELEVEEVAATWYLTYDPDGKNLCSGDSGGPALRETDAGWEIVGVSSFVWASTQDTLCDEGGAAAARVDLDPDWLAEQFALEDPAGSDDDDEGGGGEAGAAVETTSGNSYLPPDDVGTCGASTVRPVLGGWLASLVLVSSRRRRPNRP